MSQDAVSRRKLRVQRDKREKDKDEDKNKPLRLRTLARACLCLFKTPIARPRVTHTIAMQYRTACSLVLDARWRPRRKAKQRGAAAVFGAFRSPVRVDSWRKQAAAGRPSGGRQDMPALPI